VNLDNGSEIHADAGFVRKGEGLFAVEGGTTTAIAEPTGIAVANATSFTVLVTAATDISSANFAWASSEDFAFVVADEHEPGSGASLLDPFRPENLIFAAGRRLPSPKLFLGSHLANVMETLQMHV
jgi:hypothetical protein